MAVGHRHFRLASLSFVSILANVLTIALSGIFVIRETTILTDVNAIQVYSPILNASVLMSSLTFETNIMGSVARASGEPFQFLLSNITSGTPLPPWTTNERYYLPINLTLEEDKSANHRLTTLGFEGATDCIVLTELQGTFAYEFSLNSDATQIKFQTTENFSNGTKAECFVPMGMTDDTITFADKNHPTTQIFVSGNPAGQTAVETFTLSYPGFSDHYENKIGCQNQFVGLWARAKISLSDKLSIVNGPAKTENIGFTTSATANTTSVSLEKLVIVCKPRTYAASYNVTIGPKGQVLNAVELPNSTFVVNDTITDGIFKQLRTPFSYPNDLLTWHNDSRARDWMSFFVSKIAKSDSLLDPTAPLPDGNELGKRVSDVFRRLFALTMAVNQNTFIELQEPVKVTAQRLTTVNRVFLSAVMYKIALVILCIDIVVVLNIYLRMPKPFLPRMPTNIASIVSFFAASYFAQELAEEARTCGTPEELVGRLKTSDQRFGFGNFVGTDGGFHVGIEREPFVHSLDDGQGTRRRRQKFLQA
jgi:hypothetical protein